jgi:hypothetical protein
MAFFEITQIGSIPGCPVTLDVVSRSSSQFTATHCMTEPWTGNRESRSLDRLILAASSDTYRSACFSGYLEGRVGSAGTNRQ